MTTAEAYYLPVDDDTFESTAATTSPWDLDAQHGGPPSALLARAMDRTTDDPAFTIARLTVDMLGPIPQGRVRTEAEVVRPGRRVELVAARLFATRRWPARRPPGGCGAGRVDAAPGRAPGRAAADPGRRA